MHKLVLTKRYLKDLKKAHKRGKNIDKAEAIVDLLQEGKSLPKKHVQHKLSGNWLPCWECHIEPDWLLIYEYRDDALILHRTGSHADLFD